MYILIVNEDPLGRALASALVERGYEVAYLDSDEEYCQMVATELGCLVIHGETTSIRALQEAGIERSDVLVTLLEKDSKNIIVGLFGRQFNVPTILSSMRQQHYRAAYQLAGIENIFSGFDYLFNQLLVAIEEPNVRHIMSVGSGRNKIAAFDVFAESPLIGRPLNVVWELPDYPRSTLVLGLLKSKAQSFKVSAERPIIDVGDELLVLGPQDDLHHLSQLISPSKAWHERLWRK